MQVPKKILWGTDYPLRIYPTMQKPDFKTFLEEFKRVVDVDEQNLRAITGSNF